MESPRTAPRAFTLIELLVVITIIAILAGIALPVFSRVMERGKGTKDLSNLRQIGLGLLSYINDNDGFLPGETTPGEADWAARLVSEERIQGTKVFLSAFDPRPEVSTGNFPVSFGLNSGMTGSTDARNTGKHKNVSSLVMLAVAPTGGSPGSLTFSTLSNNAKISQPAPAPKRGTMSSGNITGVLFADMHVENVKWSDFTSTTAPLKIFWNPNP